MKTNMNRNTGRTWFKKGMIPWNKGFKTGLVPKSAFVKNDPRLMGEKHPGWKGNKVGYVGLHYWVRRRLGSADVCIRCGSIQTVQWANKSREYKRELDDWLKLCRKCHMKYDNMVEKARETKKVRHQ